jgi:hypothetical protein
LNDSVQTREFYELKLSHEYDVPVTYTLGSETAAMMKPFVPGDDATVEQKSLALTPDYGVS